MAVAERRTLCDWSFWGIPTVAAFFYNKEYKEAHKAFIKAYKIFPEDLPTKKYAMRCQKILGLGKKK